MSGKRLVLIGVGGLLVLVVVVVLTAALTPANTEPAFAAAITFTNAAATGDDDTAFALLDDTMQAYVLENCPDGSVSACVQSYTPPEWGGIISAVFRRAIPDAGSWDVDLIATYEEETGFTGVCIYNRVEQDAAGDWRVAGWAGFIHCADAASRNMATNPDTPFRAP